MTSTLLREDIEDGPSTAEPIEVPNPKRHIGNISLWQNFQKRIIGFNTVLIGSGPKARSILSELKNAGKFGDHSLSGYLTVSDQGGELDGLMRLGCIEDLSSAIEAEDIQEVIIATETEDTQSLGRILNLLDHETVVIKIIPDLSQHLAGMVRMRSEFGTDLIQIETEILTPWQKFIKRSFDIAFSASVLLLGFPLFLVIAILVKKGSKGPVFFRQERIGLHGEPFQIIKFRSMRSDAEVSGPQLSSEDDPRITPNGRFLRSTRLDELPQFWNVLVGEMSLIGPRPERQFFIDQIMERAPHYPRLHRIKPGITSWGQVKFGYAENVGEMIERLRYDLLYLENVSLKWDLKILVYTALVMLQGRGK